MIKRVFLLLIIISVPGCSPLDSLERAAVNLEFLAKRVEYHYKKLLEKDPGNVNFKISYAKFSYQRKNFSQVEEILKDVKTDEARLLLAKSYANKGDYTSALEIFESLKDIKDDEALYLYGLTCEEKNLFPQAKDIYEKVKEPPYSNLARARLSSLALRFQEDLPAYLKKIIETSPTQKNFPNACAVVLFFKEELKITKDNKQERSIHALVKVLNDRGRLKWGETVIDYDSTYEKVELEFARTITPSGKIIYAGKENIRDVSKYLDFPLYSNLRAFIISMPEIVVGSFIEYKVKIYRSKLITNKDFSSIYDLQETNPILEAELNISAPAERKLFFKVLNREHLPSHIDCQPRIIEQDGWRTYLFKFKNIPQLIPESNMVDPSFVVPALVISSFSSWSDFYDWWASLYRDKLDLTEEMKKVLIELTKDANSEYEKAGKIYEFCAQNIRYVAVEYGKAGFEPHKASEVFVNKYGDCKDQAILLVALLRGAGLSAYPVLIPTREVYSLQEDLPASYFNHAIAAVKIGENLIFMDPTASFTSFNDLPLSDQNRKVLLFLDDTYKILTTPLCKDNLFRVKIMVGINKQEVAKIATETSYKGFYASLQRLYVNLTPPQLIVDDIQEKIKKFASLSKLLQFFIKESKLSSSEEPALNYKFLAYNFLSKVRDLRIIPFLGREFVESSWVNKEKRIYPLYLGSPSRTEVEAIIRLPSNLDVEYLPEGLEINSDLLDFKLSYEINNRELIFKESAVVKKDTIYPEDYPEFKKIVEDILHNCRQNIILKKKDGKRTKGE